jgi:hypothetical protein
MSDPFPFPFPFPIPCSAGGCVEAARNADRTVTMTSSIAGNDDSITYTGDEFDTFRQDVKDGKWDFL